MNAILMYRPTGTQIWVKKNWVGNFCLGEKKVGNFSGLKGFGSEIFLSQKRFLSKNFLGKKILGRKNL